MISMDANKASLDATGSLVQRLFAVLLLLLASTAIAEAGFRTPESLVRNVYAYYGKGAPELSHGLPRDEVTAQKFFDPSLRKVWSSAGHEPYDFLVQSATWNLGAISIAILRRQF